MLTFRLCDYGETSSEAQWKHVPNLLGKPKGSSNWRFFYVTLQGFKTVDLLLWDFEEISSEAYWKHVTN